MRVDPQDLNRRQCPGERGASIAADQDCHVRAEENQREDLRARRQSQAHDQERGHPGGRDYPCRPLAHPGRHREQHRDSARQGGEQDHPGDPTEPVCQRQDDLEPPVEVDPLAVSRGEAEWVEGRQTTILQDPLARAEMPPDIRVGQLLAG